MLCEQDRLSLIMATKSYWVKFFKIYSVLVKHYYRPWVQEFCQSPQSIGNKIEPVCSHVDTTISTVLCKVKGCGLKCPAILVLLSFCSRPLSSRLLLNPSALSVTIPVFLKMSSTGGCEEEIKTALGQCHGNCFS